MVTAGVTATQTSTAGEGDADRLQVVQEEFLNIVGNLTSSVKDVEELMAVLHSQNGRHIGRLLMEGVMLGAAQKDSGARLAEFWTQLQERFSPELQDKMKDYTDFFRSMDISTIPYFLGQMFKKDELGNSLADVPMGQLVDMVQPTAARYGVDVRAIMNSLMGKSKNNARDLIFAALDNLNVTSLFHLFNSQTGNEVRPNNEVRMSNDAPMDGDVTMSNKVQTDAELELADTKPKAGEKLKKARADSTLRLFRPLVASLLRENKIDLEADAVLQVLAPLLNGDIMSQIAPLLSAFGLQAGDGLAPVLRNLLGGEREMGKNAQTAGILGVMGTLLARGNNQNMDLEGMLTMASMFMNMNGKQRERKPSKAKEPDMSVLADLAGNLLENNDVSSLIKQASSFLTSSKEESVPSGNRKESEISRSKERTQPTTDDTPKQITDMLESILLNMQTQQDKRRIKDSYLFGKAFIARNANIGGLVQQVSAFLSMYSMDPAKERRFQDLRKLLSNNNLADVQWTRVFEALHQEETRSSLIQTMTPTLSEFVLQLGSKEAQQKILMVAELKIQALFASYGLKDVTFKNFPERLTPLAKQMAAAWRLQLNPATHLVHLRNYLKLLHEWVSEGVAYMGTLPSREVSF